MEINSILLGITLILYTISGMLFITGVTTARREVGRAAFGFGIGGLAVQTAVLVVSTSTLHLAPFMHLFGSLALFAWAVMAVYLMADRGQRIVAMGAFACLVSAASTGAALMVPREVSLIPALALKSPWSGIHVASSIVACAGFVLAFGSALGYGLQGRLLKSKRINSFQRRLPPLDVLDQFAYRMVAFSFPMLTLSLITGSLWAQTARGSYWDWDPKETWALITWLVYAAYLHLRIMQGWRGKWANRLLLTGFACIIITYVGAKLLTH